MSVTLPEFTESDVAIVPVGAAISSVGASLPERVVPNAEIAPRIGVTDEWIVRRTGIKARRVAGPNERLTTHATQAGAFDIGAACTGFLSALAVGTGQIESGRAQTVLVIGADFMSRILDPDDRTTAAVFADGAGAVVLTATGETSRIGPIVLGADGAGADHIIVPRDEGVIRMRGHETFREAVARLSLATVQAARAAGTRLDDIDLFVYHQANGRILSAVGERLDLPSDRVVDCISQ